MRFMVMVKATKDSEQEGAPDPQGVADMNKFTDELIEAGVMLGYEGLHPSSKGARVHFSGKNCTVIDGPFAETKELIAGFSIWQVNSLEEAIEWVEAHPQLRPRRIRDRDPPGLRAGRLCTRLLRRRYSAGKRNPRSTGREGSKEPGRSGSKGIALLARLREALAQTLSGSRTSLPKPRLGGRNLSTPPCAPQNTVAHPSIGTGAGTCPAR